MNFKSPILRLRRLLAPSSGLMEGAIAGVSMGLWLMGAWLPLEQLGYNGLFQARTALFPKMTWDNRLAVIAIDEKSLKAYGRLQSWQRDRYAQLLQVLAPDPPAAIAFDLFFSEPSPDDDLLAQEIKYHGGVILAVGFDPQGQVLKTVPQLAEVAHLGHTLVRTDSDGIVRQISLSVNQFPSLSVSLLRVYEQSLAGTITAKPAQKTAPIPPLPQPSPEEPEQAIWLNWPQPVSKLPTYSFIDVVTRKVDPHLFADKIVLVGVTGTGLDPLRTPFEQNPPTAGVYLQAALADNLLQGRFLQRLSTLGTFLLLLGTVCLSVRLLMPRSWQGRLLILLALFLSWWVVALLGLSFWGIWLPTGAIWGTLMMTVGGIQWREQHEKQQLMELFAQHVSSELADVIWRRKAEIFTHGQLEPQELTVTVLFTDIRSFTTVSEGLSPRELLQWLNVYLEAMSGCIMEQGGVVDKYIGDAILGVFGIPFARTEEAAIQQDALHAVAASLAMHRRLAQLNQTLQAEGKPLIKIGIGLHTGAVIFGSVGGGGRLNSSVIGDTVNVAARLEAMNKTLDEARPYPILLSDQTWHYVKESVLADALGSFRLRGKETETQVYSIVGELGQKSIPQPSTQL